MKRLLVVLFDLVVIVGAVLIAWWLFSQPMEPRAIWADEIPINLVTGAEK